MDRDIKIVIVNRDREFSSDRGPNRIVIVNRNRDREFSSDRGEFFSWSARPALLGGLAGLARNQIDHCIVNRESWIMGLTIAGLGQIWIWIVDREHDPRS